MSLVAYDITLLVLFIIFSSVFLYLNRKNLAKDGPFYLYRTKWGLNLINSVGSKYKKTLKALSYVSIALGYALMAGILFLVFQTVYLYLTSPISRIIRAPPIAPLIPYFPKLFGLQSFFPPFYFIYFIVAIIIVATVHEFSHGIFARSSGIKIKSTGFAFLKYFPALFGAFVEQDEKQMESAKKFQQMSVLSAGVFANMIIAVLFYVILFWFFVSFFTAAGVTFNTYSYSVVGVENITSVNGINLSNASYDGILVLTDEIGLNKIQTTEGDYAITKDILMEQSENNGLLVLYNDAPAINANLSYTITKINRASIDSIEKLSSELMKYSPGDSVTVTALNEDGSEADFEIVLGENPGNKTNAWLGVGFYDSLGRGVLSKVLSLFPSYTKPNIYYTPKNDFVLFIKDFLWWVVIINLLVALFNMMPLGALDGGRFFYLTILGITGSEKAAKKSYSFITYLILFLFVVLMIKWVLGFF